MERPGTLYKKKFLATIKKIFLATIKKFPSNYKKNFLATIKNFFLATKIKDLRKSKIKKSGQ